MNKHDVIMIYLSGVVTGVALSIMFYYLGVFFR